MIKIIFKNYVFNFIKDSLFELLSRKILEKSFQKPIPLNKILEQEGILLKRSGVGQSLIKRSKFLFFILLLVLLFIVATIYIVVGISKSEVEMVGYFSYIKTNHLLRLFIAVTVGFALSFSGTIYQCCFRSPYVDPYILGISSGAAFGSFCASVFGMWAEAKFFAIFFSALVSFFIMILNFSAKRKPLYLVLAGLFINSIFFSSIIILGYISKSSFHDIIFWLMGGFYSSSKNDLCTLLLFTISFMIIAEIFSWRLNILSTSNEDSRSLGMSSIMYSTIFISLATIVAALSVSIVGIVGWLGLIVPNIARMMFGSDNRWLIPGGALIGAIFLIISDSVVLMINSLEFPVGMVVTLLSIPYFIFILMVKCRGKS